MNVRSLARPEIVAMKPYSSARREAPGRGILLNANESPRALLEDFRAIPGLNRYPEPQPAALIERLAERYGVPADWLLVTRGSDEGIDLLTRVFCRAGKDAVLHCPPTFGMYRIAAQIQGAELVSVNRKADERFRMDEEAVLKSLAETPRIKLVFLTSPNNPSGDVLRAEFLTDLVSAVADRALVIVDEAYAEFCDQPSAAQHIAAHENLVVLRTLSKAWGAAGLRVGVVLAQKPVISLLRRVIAPYPLPTPVVEMALKMLGPELQRRQQRLLQEVRTNKRALVEMLGGRPFVRELIEGAANFVLVRADDAPGLLRFCADRGVVLRGFANEPMLRDCLRISVGTHAEQEALAAALDAWEQER